MWPQNFLFVPWFNFVNTGMAAASPSIHPEAGKPAQVTNTSTIINPDNVGHAIWPCVLSKIYNSFVIVKFSAGALNICVFCSFFCRRLTLTWSGWWLCMIMQGGQRKSCPFNRATVSSSPSTRMLSGAVAGSTAGRASSPGIMRKAPQVWWCH